MPDAPPPPAAEGAALIALMAATSCADVTLLMAHEWIHAAKKVSAPAPPITAAERAALDDVLAKADQAAKWSHGNYALRQLMPEMLTDLENLEIALGGLDEARRAGAATPREGGADAEPCKSVIACGPGHQSRDTCERKGPHAVHWSRDVGGYWLGMKAVTTFFDDPPFDDEGEALAALARDAATRR